MYKNVASTRSTSRQSSLTTHGQQMSVSDRWCERCIQTDE